jgi:hypothetical protein
MLGQGRWTGWPANVNLEGQSQTESQLSNPAARISVNRNIVRKVGGHVGKGWEEMALGIWAEYDRG